MVSPIGPGGGASPGPRIAISEGLVCLVGGISNEVWKGYISTCDGGTVAHQGRVGGVAQRHERPEQTQAASSDRGLSLPKEPANRLDQPVPGTTQCFRRTRASENVQCC